MQISPQNKSGIPECHFSPTRLALPLVIILLLAALASSVFAQDYTYQVAYSFTPTQGSPSFVDGDLVLDTHGNLYGTSAQGGAFGLGTVFMLETTGKQTVLHSFSGTGGDGAGPSSSVLLDAQGNIYGNTASGGDLSCQSPNGCGTVYKLDPAGNETILYAFTGAGGDGTDPRGDLAMDAQGNLYGTTGNGGQGLSGTIFKVTSSGVETRLHTFNCCSEGAGPQGLVIDGSGNLFGTTRVGGTGHGQGCGSFGCGTLFEFTKNGILFTLHSFDPSAGDAGTPNPKLLLDVQNNLYGTSPFGGFAFKHRPIGSGMVFKVDIHGNETAVHTFCLSGVIPCLDGAAPSGGLVMDGAGNLFGTTPQGGSHNGKGTIYRIDAGHNETVLYNFVKAGSGSTLAMDSQGDLYGTAGGGTYNIGLVFGMLTPASATTTTITSTPNPSKAGDTVTFTAIVSTLALPPPDGEIVSFFNRKTLIGSATLTGGMATFSTSTLLAGTRPITAVYGGDPRLIGSSSTVKQVVKK